MAVRLDSAMGDYLKEIMQYDLLTPEEEKELGAQIRAAADSERLVASGEITLAEYERLQQAAAAARERMVGANLRLVISVAKNFRNKGLPMEDLIEEGNVGLMHAVDRFDPEVGARFSTYASYWIDQAIRRAVQNATQMIHIPSYLMEQIGRMRLTLRQLEEQLGRPPSVHELAEHMGVSPRKAQAISQALRACNCPNQATTAEDGTSWTDSLADTRNPAPHDGLYEEAETEFVLRMLERITEREATVLKLRYGLNDDGKRMTLKQIGEAIGLTRERVRQIEKEAKQKLEEYLKEVL
ncbi:MAG: sigma-70 family RNA polymerase sigma factor [Planctomycetota bacterium]|nr:MAG: sigma-70 family RNA polymerase sigma factor [Planctomycetota bacterium]